MCSCLWVVETGNTVVLCTKLISGIHTGDAAKIEAACSNKEAKRVKERVAEEATEGSATHVKSRTGCLKSCEIFKSLLNLKPEILNIL